MTRRRHPPAPGSAPRPQPRRACSIDEVLEQLRGLPTVQGENLTRVRAYLAHKQDTHPDWWSAQSPEQLAALCQVFGVRYQAS